MSGTKIKSLKSLEKLIPLLKKRGKTIVFTNGCFDLLHYGHVMYLEKAKSKGDILIVALNSDASVRKIKGAGRPIIKQSDRAHLIAALECVDFVTLFNEATPINVIKRIKPSVLIKGSDWNKKTIVGAEFVRAHGGKVLTVKLASGRSTTNLIKKIIETK